MSREVRRVSANWEHPRDARGYFIPLLGGSFKEKLEAYKIEACQWALGNELSYATQPPSFVPRDASTDGMTFEEGNGSIPKKEDYMPDWPEAERTHYQMYESTSEGTPISPVMETPKALARWLADNNAPAFADMGATYEQWLATIRKGWAPSAVSGGNGLVSGVEGLHHSVN